MIGRWTNWQPKKNHTGIAPTKTTKSVSVVFEGSPQSDSPKIKANRSCQILTESEPTKPTKLAGTDPERGVPYTQWLADRLNRLFAEHGAVGKSGHITATAVADGLSHAGAHRRTADLFRDALAEASRAYAARAEPGQHKTRERRNEGDAMSGFTKKTD